VISHISDDRVFYLTLRDPSNNELPGAINPIVDGLSITPAKAEELILCLGYCSWWDKGDEYMRTCEIKFPPQISQDRREYKVIDPHNYTYVFTYLDKVLYDDVVHKLISRSPDALADDLAVQKYIKSLNPYL
jgi:hypothetical protein